MSVGLHYNTQVTIIRNDDGGSTCTTTESMLYENEDMLFSLR